MDIEGENFVDAGGIVIRNWQRRALDFLGRVDDQVRRGEGRARKQGVAEYDTRPQVERAGVLGSRIVVIF